MRYSLYECRDGTLLVTPEGFAPPLAAYRLHGEGILISSAPRRTHDPSLWGTVGREIEARFHCVVSEDQARQLCDVPAWSSHRLFGRDGQKAQGAGSAG